MFSFHFLNLLGDCKLQTLYVVMIFLVGLLQERKVQPLF
jgi:hypothetical protein